jgi:protein-L-isoaspartate(D-aspartate) O-methyltransferase
MDVERARFNMIEQQIRTWEVLDQRVLDLVARVPREEYVPPAYRALAFMDLEIPLGHGEKMLAPKLEARIVQELAVETGDRVLEVGTGSGYMSALLAGLAAHVYTVDILGEFTRTAAEKLTAHGVQNVTLDTGDAARGWDRHGPYDVIAITGSVPVLPEAFPASLAPGGRLFVVIGEPPVMQATLITRLAPDAMNSVALFETCIPPLRNAPEPERFVF